MSVSPRIPVGLLPGGRRLDLRPEDLLLVVMVVFWAVDLCRGRRLYLTPLFPPLAVYWSLGVISTGYAIAFLGLDALRSLFYILKETEYYLLYFLVANWLETERDVWRASKAMLMGGLLNGAWLVFQIVTGRRQALLAPVGGDYGPALIGEGSCLSTGGFYLVVLALTVGFWYATKDVYRKVGYLLLTLWFSVGLASSLSRAAILGMVGGLLLHGFMAPPLVSRRVLYWLALIMSIALTCRILPAGVRVFDSAYFRYSLTEARVEPVWKNELRFIPEHWYLGGGKSVGGYIEELPDEEAHNHWLRVLVETGLPGLLSFIWVVVGCIRMGFCLQHMARSKGSCTLRALATGSVIMVFAISIASLAQDAFVPVKVMEPFWSVLGMVAAGLKLGRCENRCRVRSRDYG